MFKIIVTRTYSLDIQAVLDCFHRQGRRNRVLEGAGPPPKHIIFTKIVFYLFVTFTFFPWNIYVRQVFKLLTIFQNFDCSTNKTRNLKKKWKKKDIIFAVKANS